MIFNHFKVLKSCSLSTQSLASCVNYFVWNFFTCFSNTKIGSVTSFSILFNFQGPVSASANRLTTWLFYHRSGFLSSFIFSKFFDLNLFTNLEHLESLSHSCRTFSRLLVLFELLLAGTRKSFFCLSAWRSSIIPYPARDVNTFLQISSGFFRTDSNQLHPLVFFKQRLFVYYNVLYKRAEYRQHPLLRRGKPYFLCADCQEVRSQILFRKFSVIFGESYKTQNVVVLPLTYH